MDRLYAFEGVDLGYGRNVILRSVDFDIRAGDFLGIVGPNGAGKTTLLKAVLGLLKPMCGHITRSSSAARIGYVPQRQAVDSIYPLTVQDIVLMGCYSRLGAIRRPGRRERGEASRALDLVGIADLASRSYRSLSGGQQQRALIARALIARPDILLLDEPTNGMDLVSETAMMDLLLRLHRQDRMTVVMVSHLLHVVVNYARRIAIVNEGSVREGDVDELVTEATLGDVYGIPVTVAQVDGRTVVLPGVEGAGKRSSEEALSWKA